MRPLPLLAAALLAVVPIAHAGTAASAHRAEPVSGGCLHGNEAAAGSAEPTALGAGVVLDEHLLTDGSRDQDYNGGGEITLSGGRAGPVGYILDRALGALDHEACREARFSGEGWRVRHAFAAGLLIFTPQDLAAHDVVPGDRPYASLFFLSVGRRYASPRAEVVYDSSLTVGMLGLSAAGAVQRALHHLTGSAQPHGWSHQISSGGEPTARYELARQALIGRYGAAGWRADSKWTTAVSVGTVTEASLALATRFGRIESPWWAFTPEQDTYVEETQPTPPPLPRHAPAELFAFAGVRIKVRAYNAFLQGQFRHSDLRYGEGDLNQVLGEAWAGLEYRTATGWAIEYLARWDSPELRSGIGSRSIFWGSVQISKSLR